MFKNLFRKKQDKEKSDTLPDKQVVGTGEKILATGNSNCFYKIIRDISDETSFKLDSSTIPLWVGQLYMHYWDNVTPEDYNNPEWQNQGLYFWLAEEDFPNKSLPPVFEKKEKKFFRIINEIQVFRGIAIPWFGMPGGGLKMGFGDPNTPTPISTVKEQGYIEYLEVVELSDINSEILNDRKNYILLANSNIKAENNIFYLDGNPITLSQAYSIGVIDIAKIT